MTEKQKQEKILPCPFCGSKKITVDVVYANKEGGGYGITCQGEEGCMGCIATHDYFYPTELDAIGAWNKRAIPIQPQAKIEAAIRAFEERAEDFLTVNGCDLKGDFADLLRWVLGQPQDTWKDEDFVETKK